MFKYMPNRLNYFDKLHKIQYKAHGFKYKLNYPKYLIRDKKIFYIDRDRDGIINNFLIKSCYNYVKIDKLTDNNIVINDFQYIHVNLTNLEKVQYFVHHQNSNK